MRQRILQEELKLQKKGCKHIAGLDEAGRGPLAGPVVAAAVMIRISDDKFLIQKEFQNLKIKKLLNEIKDSKKLSPKKREELYKILTRSSFIEWGIGRVSEKIIDKTNILAATKLAMAKAIKKLKTRPDFLILDGNFKLDLSLAQKSIVKADEKVFSCMAAGIIAKVARDRIMKKYAKKYPYYCFEKHKGYPTKLHRKMIQKYGACKIHRQSFVLLKSLHSKDICDIF